MGAAARGVDRGKRLYPGYRAENFLTSRECCMSIVQSLIFTENMRERKHLLESRSDATIVVPRGNWYL